MNQFAEQSDLSPCRKVCAIGRSTGLCIGCGRTLAEIAGWASMNPDERRRVMHLLPDRMPLAAADGA